MGGPKTKPQLLPVLMEMADGADIGWFNGLGNDTADGAIVACKGGGLLGGGVRRVDNVFNASCCKVHI